MWKVNQRAARCEERPSWEPAGRRRINGSLIGTPPHLADMKVDSLVLWLGIDSSPAAQNDNLVGRVTALCYTSWMPRDDQRG
ncbi:MAG: hypothetical protein KIT39_17815 [Nitrospirales bacterium]|nr:hypothetical protein [Nitrospirales bacterium]